MSFYAHTDPEKTSHVAVIAERALQFQRHPRFTPVELEHSLLRKYGSAPDLTALVSAHRWWRLQLLCIL